MIGRLRCDALFSLSLLLSLVLVAQVPPAMGKDSMADDSNDSEDEVQLDAELSNSCSTCTSVPNLNGEAEFEQEVASGGTVKEGKIQAQVMIPIPNSLGIDATTARTASVILELSNTDPNAPYATCTLAFKKVTGKKNGAKATYVLKLQTKLKGTTHVSGKKQSGTCTLDAIDLNVQPTDTAIITANGLDVLSGTFGGEDENEDEDN